MRTTVAARLIAICALCLSAAMARAADENPNDLNSYLVDINAGTVSAAGIVSLDSAITTIETAQDLVVAIQPLTSADRKSAFGLAITPARTTLLPMSGDTYVRNAWWRLLGNLTASYAQNEAELSGQTYKKRAFSLDTVYFFDLAEDPTYAASVAFQRCSNATGDAITAKLADLITRREQKTITELQFNEESKKVLGERATETRACIAGEMAKAPWNSARVSVSFGRGRIAGNGGSYSLGRHWNLNAQHPVTAKGLIQMSLRHAGKALDPETLGQAQLGFKSSRLAAVRYTYGGMGNANLRVIAEASNARSSSAAAFQDSFRYALGVDKKLAKGAWLEFRLGRSRANNNGVEQTVGLLNLNVAPTLFEITK